MGKDWVIFWLIGEGVPASSRPLNRENRVESFTSCYIQLLPNLMIVYVSRRELCSHLHFVILARKLKDNEKHTLINNGIDYDRSNISTTTKTEQQRIKTIDLQMTEELPYKFSPDILRKPDMICLASNEQLSFEPSQLYCHLCQYVLSDSVFPQGCSSYGGNGVLLTNNDPFRKINIKLKKCQNPICGAINSLFPIDQGKQ